MDRTDARTRTCALGSHRSRTSSCPWSGIRSDRRAEICRRQWPWMAVEEVAKYFFLEFDDHLVVTILRLELLQMAAGVAET